jgi:hypothetical protein
MVAPADMEWCCDGFRNAFEQRKDRGLFVYVRPPSSANSGPLFSLATRSVRQEDIPLLQGAAKTLPEMDINLQSQTGMRFCPWCGIELKRFEATYPKLLDEEIIAEFKTI